MSRAMLAMPATAPAHGVEGRDALPCEGKATQELGLPRPVGGDEAEEGLPPHLLGGVAVEPFRPGVPEGDHPLGGLADDGVLGPRHDGGEPAEDLFGLLSGREIPHGDQHPRDVPRRVPARSKAPPDPPPAPRGRGEKGGVLRIDPLPPKGREQESSRALIPQREGTFLDGAPQELFGGDAGEVLHEAVPDHVAEVLVQHRDALLGRKDRVPVELAGFLGAPSGGEELPGRLHGGQEHGGPRPLDHVAVGRDPAGSLHRLPIRVAGEEDHGEVVPAEDGPGDLQAVQSSAQVHVHEDQVGEGGSGDPFEGLPPGGRPDDGVSLLLQGPGLGQGHHALILHQEDGTLGFHGIDPPTMTTGEAPPGGAPA